MESGRCAIILAVLFVAVVVCLAVLPGALEAPYLNERNVKKWIKGDLARLTARLEEHHRAHGCYPREFSERFDCPDFPRPHARASTCYTELDVDDYLLGVIVEYSPKRMDFYASGIKQRLGFLTTAGGPPAGVSRFVGPDFEYFREGRRRWAHERWRILEGERGPLASNAGMEESHRALDDADPRVRAEAMVALVLFRDTRAVERIVRALRDEDVGVRRRAAWALGRLGDARTASALEQAATDPDDGVRRRVAWALPRVRRRPEARDRGSTGTYALDFDFEQDRLDHFPSQWHELFAGPTGSVCDETAGAGRRSFRLQAAGADPQCAYFRVTPLSRVELHITLRVDAGTVRFGFVERYGPGCEFYNRFLVDAAAGTVEFRARPDAAPVPLGPFARGRWFTLEARFDLEAGSAVLLLDGERETETACAPHRFESPRHAVRLGRWGIAPPPAPAVAFVDEVWVHASGRVLR